MAPFGLSGFDHSTFNVNFVALAVKFKIGPGPDNDVINGADIMYCYTHITCRHLSENHTEMLSSVLRDSSVVTVKGGSEYGPFPAELVAEI